jgi:chromosome segregation ATPase
MEEKARSRADGAEAETYRLKGLLMHMEHVASSIRSQGGEEKERLRQEHQRLYTLQSSLENERNAFQARMTDELSILKKKGESIEAETTKLSNERRQQNDAIASQHRALDTDRSEFAAYVMTHTKQAEATTERFKEEEMRLTRAREELMRDRAILEQRKAAATGDLQEAEALRSQVIAGRDEVAKEKVRLQQAIAELNSAAAQLSTQGETLDKQAKVMESKERSLHESQGHLRIAQSALKKRESELVTGIKELEARMLELGGQDRELTQRRMELVARQREVSSAGSKAALENNQITIVVSENSPSNSGNSKFSPRQAWPEEDAASNSKSSSPEKERDSGNSDWLISFKDRLASGRSSSRVTEKDRRVNDELLQSRKMLQAAKSTLTRTSSTRVQAERMLSDEAKFLANLQGQRAKAKNSKTAE